MDGLVNKRRRRKKWNEKEMGGGGLIKGNEIRVK